MGNTSNEKEIVVGEVLLTDNEEKAYFSCSLPNSLPLNLIVQDRLGRTMISSNHTLDKNESAFEFSVRSLGAGDYHAWIYMGDEVFVRPFRIEKAEESGFFDKVRSLFK